MRSAVRFAPLWPAGFVNFHGAAHGRFFAGRGSLFFPGVGRPSLVIMVVMMMVMMVAVLVNLAMVYMTIIIMVTVEKVILMCRKISSLIRLIRVS